MCGEYFLVMKRVWAGVSLHSCVVLEHHSSSADLMRPRGGKSAGSPVDGPNDEMCDFVLLFVTGSTWRSLWGSASCR